MFLHPAWIEREAPLARCPLGACRRSGICSHQDTPTPCRRTHETKDAARNALADKIERLMAEIIAKNPHNRQVAEPGSLAFENNLKALYDGVRQADEAYCAKLKAEGRLKPAMAAAAPTPLAESSATPPKGRARRRRAQRP